MNKRFKIRAKIGTNKFKNLPKFGLKQFQKMGHKYAESASNISRVVQARN